MPQRFLRNNVIYQLISPKQIKSIQDHVNQANSVQQNAGKVDNVDCKNNKVVPNTITNNKRLYRLKITSI